MTARPCALEGAHPHSPRISVLIPCFNQGAYLDEAVQSVVSQTCQDFEILVVDDGSTDEATVRLLAEYTRPRTTVFRTGNQGLARARNFLVARAAGDFLCALDADDRLHTEYFEKALARFEQDPGLTFVSAWIQEFGERHESWRQDRCDLPALLAEDTVMTAALVRREAVTAAGGYDEAMPAQGDEDWDLWLRLVKAGRRGTIIPETLFYYRKRHGSMSASCTTGGTHLELVRYLFRKHQDAYTAFLPEVLLAKEGHIADLLRANDRLEREIDGRLRRQITWRLAELAAVRARIDPARWRLPWAGDGARGGTVGETTAGPAAGAAPQLTAQDYGALEAEYRRALGEVAALRASASWRLTSPLRAAYDRLRPGRGRRK